MRVCDPTLLLTREEYCALVPASTTSSASQNKSLVCYMLGHPCVFPKDEIDEFVERNELKFRYIPSQGAEKKNLYRSFETPTVQDWLKAYRDAEYIVTNSFHGTVFAILMQKKFVVFPLDSSKAGMNGRIETLLSSLNLKNRMLTPDTTFKKLIEQPIDWFATQQHVSRMRDSGADFLFKNLAPI